MNPATSPSKLNRVRPKRLVSAVVTLGGYIIAAFGLRIFLYCFHLNVMLLVPLMAELVLIKSVWTTMAFWKGVIARCIGLTFVEALTYYLYLIPVVYQGKEPWSEEALVAYVNVTVQTAVAAAALLASRKLTRCKSCSTC